MCAVAWVFVSNLEAPITSVATKRRPTETERKLCSTCILCPSIRGWCQLNRNFTNLRVLLHTDSITSSAQAQHSELADKRSRNVLRLPWTFICKYQTQDIYCMYQYVKKQKIDTFFYLFGHKFESGAVFTELDVTTNWFLAGWNNTCASGTVQQTLMILTR